MAYEVRPNHIARGECAMAQQNGKANGSFHGWRRENGRVGVRNHVVILPLDDLSNAACEAVANNIKGAMALPHAYGRLQFGEDLEVFFRTLIGTGANPNVAAVVVIGIEPSWTGREGSMPMTTTAATLGLAPVPIRVRKKTSRSSPN